jgi:hypothetical protein
MAISFEQGYSIAASIIDPYDDDLKREAFIEMTAEIMVIMTTVGLSNEQKLIEIAKTILITKPEV